MPKTQKTRKNYLQKYKRYIGTAILIAAIAVVGYLVATMRQDDTGAAISAAKGTPARADQIDDAELKQEAQTDSEYDALQSTNAQDGLAAANSVSEGLQDEE